MFNGHSPSRNLPMGDYSSDGSTPVRRYESQFPLETDQLSLHGSSLMYGSDWMDTIVSRYIGTNEFFAAAINSEPMDISNNQVNESETSEASMQTEEGCGKYKLNPAQRDRKRKADVNYRQKLEDKMRVLHGLAPGCSKIKGKVAMLDETISYVQYLQRAVQIAQNINLKAVEKIDENIHLKAENERLNAENTMLRKQIGLQPSSGKHLEHRSVSLQDHHGFISEAVDKYHHGTNSEAVDKEMVPVNATSLQSGGGVILPNVNLLQSETVSASKFPRFTSVGLTQGLQEISEVNGGKSVSGLEAQSNAIEALGDACLQDQEISHNKRKRSVQDAEVDQAAKGVQPQYMATKDSVENQDKGVWNLTTTTNKSEEKQGRQGSQASDPPEEENIHIRAQIGQTTIGHGLVEKFPPTKLAASCAISNSDAAISDILLKLEADDESKVKLPDFDGLDGERITIGKYSFPISLHPIVKKIIDVYGDVSATSKMNPTIAETIYIMFCASVKEMSEQRLEQVTEGLILKWRDVIRDALSINFKVDFAMEHLKKIARGYIGFRERSKILELEDRLSAMKERSKEFMDAAEEFFGKPVSSGMFPDAQAT